MTSGVADEVLLQDTSSPLIQGSLSRFLKEDTSLLPLKDIADVRNGPQPLPDISPGENGNVRLFISAKALRPFDRPFTDQLRSYVYPDDFRRGKKLATIIDRQKIITPALSDTSNPWRIRAGVADPGVIGGHGTLMIAPEESSPIDLYGLLVILNSSVASCWVDELSVERNIELRTVAALPIPAGRNAEALSQMGKSLVELKQKSSSDFDSALEQIDELVFDAYCLPPSVQHTLVQRFIGRSDASGVVRYVGDEATWSAANAGLELTNRERGLRYVGFVQDVANGLIRIVLAGASSLEGQWIEVPRKMPGWLCRPDATFEVVGDLDDADGLDWSFQELAWQSSEMWDSLL